MLLRRARLAEALVKRFGSDRAAYASKRRIGHAAGCAAIRAFETEDGLRAAQPGSLERNAIREPRTAIPAIQENWCAGAHGIDDGAIGRETSPRRSRWLCAGAVGG